MQAERVPRSSSSTARISQSPPEERFVSASSSKMPSKTHRPSLSGPMNWLGRTSTSSSLGSYAPSKPIRISEPFGTSAFDRLTRTGQLGQGAIVVRTPQEALSITGRQRSPDNEERILEEEDDDDSSSQRARSPPLPPLPEDEVDNGVTPVGTANTRPRPTRTPPPAPTEEEVTTPCTSPRRKRRPSLKVLDEFPPVPSLPANLPPSPPQMPFEPALLSPLPSGTIDPNKILISLETSTVTFKTTLNTVKSRSSYLATYLQSLLPSRDPEEEESQSSRFSGSDASFHAIFHNHLASSGLVSPGPTTIHIFLDRPSAP